MAINYPALKIEIAKVAYNGMSDAVIANTINTTPSSGLRSFSPMEAMVVMMINGDWGWLAGTALGYVTSANASGAGAVAVSATTPWATRRTAQVIYDLLRTTFQIDMTNPTTVSALTTGLATLVTANVVTNASRNSIIGFPVISVLGWKTFGDRELDFNDIAIARAS